MEEQTPRLDKIRHLLLICLFALSTLVIFEVGIFSLSFVFGSVLILISLKAYKFFFIPRGKTLFLLLFVIISFIGLAITEVPSDSTTILRSIQLVYWLLLAIFVYNSYDFIDKQMLSKFVFWASLLFISLHVTFLPMSQNEVAFTVIIMGPLGYFFLKRYIYRGLYAIILFVLMLYNGSRTGAILSIMQAGLFLFLFTPRLNRYVRFLVILSTVLLISLNLEPVRIVIGQKIRPVNERVADLLINPEEVFRNDMSWLQRKAQINKGRQIFWEHPILGIGIFNFQKYNINIDVSDIKTDRNKIRNIDNRSAHNSYVALLSETGVIGFSLILLMFALALWPFIKHLNSIGGTFEACIFISFIGLLAYFYVISGFFGTSAWISYGLILGASKHLVEENI